MLECVCGEDKQEGRRKRTEQMRERDYGVVRFGAYVCVWIWRAGRVSEIDMSMQRDGDGGVGVSVLLSVVRHRADRCASQRKKQKEQRHRFVATLHIQYVTAH